MAANTTYSFTDLVGSINHSALTPFIFTGQGVGGVTVSKSTERSAHDVAADGSIMVSKIAGNNGVITIECQQTSPLHFWLLNWFNTLWNLPTSDWATTSVLLKNSTTGGSHVVTGVSPQKEADVPYQAQGQRVTWTLMAADIRNIPI